MNADNTTAYLPTPWIDAVAAHVADGGDDIEDVIAEALNTSTAGVQVVADVIVDEAGAVWALGHWLTEGELVHLVRAVHSLPDFCDFRSPR
jgi:hypothetical protein